MKKETESGENDYEIIINKQGNEFVLKVPELNLTVADTDINSGYEKINTEKDRLIKKYKEAQFDIPELPKKRVKEKGKKQEKEAQLDISELPDKREKKQEKTISEVSLPKSNYEQLAIKAGIVSAIFCLFFVASIYIAANIATSKIETLLFRQIPDAAPREFAGQVNILAKKIQDISPEEREKFRENLWIIMNELKPAFLIINSENSDTDSLIKR